MSCYQPPELLAARHQLAGFRCRSVEQTTWLVELAKQAHGTGTTRVFVVTEVNQTAVVAYYAWCMASIAIADLPERLRRGAGRTPQPIALPARLGVDQRHEGQGLGAALLLDVTPGSPASARPASERPASGRPASAAPSVVAACWCTPNPSRPAASTST